MRPKDKSDPDPELTTVLLFIWPLMLLITVADLLLLVFIAGLTGIFIFPVLLLCFIINYGVIRLACQEIKRRDDIEMQHKQKEDSDQNEERFSEQSQEEDSIQNREEDDKEKKNPRETAQSFYAIAALSSTWLPCVVGDQTLRIFLVSGVTSLVTKVLFLGLAVSLAGSGLQPHIYKRPFLLFCFDEGSPVLNEIGIRQCKFSEDGCRSPKNSSNKTTIADALSAVEVAVSEYKRILDLEYKIILAKNKTKKPRIQEFLKDKLSVASKFLSHVNSSREEINGVLDSGGTVKVQQRVRVCEKNETPFRLGLLSGLLLIVLLAAYATYRLHRIADYRVKLSNITCSFIIFSTGTFQHIQKCDGVHTQP